MQTTGLVNGSQQKENVGRGVSGLPSLSFLDVEKIRRETAEYDHNRSPSTGLNVSVPPLVSPQGVPSGPPPPYSYPSSTTSSVLGLAGYTSPPEVRRKSDDDKEQQPQQLRQNLPSIHEALGKDPSILYSAPPPSASLTTQTSYPAAIVSPTTPVPRSHPEPVLSGPPNPYASNPSLPSYNNDQSDRRSHPSIRHGSTSEGQPASARRPSVHDPNSHSLHAASPTSPTPPVRPNPHPMQPLQHSPMYSQQALPSSAQPNYRPFSSPRGAYTYPPPAGIIPYQSGYLQSTSWGRSDGFEIDRAEETRRAASKRSPGNGQHYGESVKHHLEIYDLETSLNEVWCALQMTKSEKLTMHRLLRAAAELWSSLGTSATARIKRKDLDHPLRYQRWQSVRICFSVREGF